MDLRITVEGDEKLAAALEKMSKVRFDAAAKYATANIYNRAVNGGTPVRTGELRMSAGIDVAGDHAIMGYTKDYAPHVEFGHRTRGGGYVQGQHFLQRNVEQERDNFNKLLKDELKKTLK